jgi:hypothetical protein
VGARLFVAFFATGIPYWQIPYAKVSLPDSLLGMGLLVVSVAAALTRAFVKGRLLPVIFVVGAAVPCAVFARVVFDGIRDPTSHNLWPFELVIAIVVGLIASSAGAFIGSVPALMPRRGSSDQR